MLLDRHLCLPNKYNRLRKPDHSVEVDINFRIYDILEVDDHRQTVTVGIHLDLLWHDDRFEVFEDNWWTEKNSTLALGGEVINQGGQKNSFITCYIFTTFLALP